MTPQEEISRGEQARRIMDDPLVKEACALMESEIAESWLTCPARDVEGREFLWRLGVTTRKFRAFFEGAMQSGQIARSKLTEKETFADKARAKMNRFRGA